MKRMPDHPLHQKLKDSTKNRLKRKSLNHLIKEQQKEHADILTTEAHLCEKLNPNSWPPKILQAEIRTTVPGVTSEEDQSEAVLRALALEEIDKHYPTASWTHIYTDGSAENAIRNRGCVACIKHPGKPPFSQGSHLREKTVFFMQKKSRLRKSENAVRLLYAKNSDLTHQKAFCLFGVFFAPSREGL